MRRRLTQHKRFVPDGTPPNFCFAKTSFMLETLYEMNWLYERGIIWILFQLYLEHLD